MEGTEIDRAAGSVLSVRFKDMSGDQTGFEKINE